MSGIEVDVYLISFTLGRRRFCDIIVSHAYRTRTLTVEANSYEWEKLFKLPPQNGVRLNRSIIRPGIEC